MPESLLYTIPLETPSTSGLMPDLIGLCFPSLQLIHSTFDHWPPSLLVGLVVFRYLAASVVSRLCCDPSTLVCTIRPFVPLVSAVDLIDCVSNRPCSSILFSFRAYLSNLDCSVSHTPPTDLAHQYNRCRICGAPAPAAVSTDALTV